MYAGICLTGELCKSLGLAFSDVFPLDHEACAANLEYAAREYLLDNSSYNKGAVEQAFEVMARMKLKPKEDYAFENNRQFLCIHIAGIYDRYTRYRRDYAVLGEVLPYNQFRKQLEQTEFFVEKQRMKKMGEESKRVWVLDFSKAVSPLRRVWFCQRRGCIGGLTACPVGYIFIIITEIT